MACIVGGVERTQANSRVPPRILQYIGKYGLERGGRPRWERDAITGQMCSSQRRPDSLGEPLEIVVGILPDQNLYYRDADKYLTMEELTRRILDKALFPKLGE